MKLDNAVKITQIVSAVIGFIGLGISLRQFAPFRYWDPFFGSNMYKIHTNINTTFDDIIGYDDVKKQLRNHINKLKAKDSNSLISFPKGYQFIGPNGVGKTMMAQAIAHECGLPFIELCVEDIPRDDITPLF